MMNPIPWLQMTNMISYQELVRTFPESTIHLTHASCSFHKMKLMANLFSYIVYTR